MTLKSHPDKHLETHVAEVRDAVHRIWRQHSQVLHDRSGEVFTWIDWAVSMHDVGKGCAAFQKYIKDVRAFRGDRRRKAHTPMSLVTALGYGKSKAWSWQQTLAVGLCAAGHHSRFKTHDELEGILRSYDWQDILVGQLDDFDWQALSVAVLPAGGAEQITASFSDDADLDELAEWLEENVVAKSLHQLNLPSAIRYRLCCQFAHSVLLEADKAYLIISPEERDKFRHSANRPIQPEIVDRFIENSTKASALNAMRNDVRQMFDQSLHRLDTSAIQTMTLPTGAGKTLLASTWALRHRERFQTSEHTPPIVIVLPFLSIIEQTQKIYQELLAESGVLLSYHSLSVREHQDSEDPDAAEFFLDTWHGDVIITTFDQFLFALLEPRSRHQMRFHQLCDALIVMDEVQALPCELWNIVSNSVRQLTAVGNCRLLAMSATQTGFLPNAVELIVDAKSVFESLKRYEIVLRHREILALDEFVAELLQRAKLWRDERVLIVLNTRNSARTVRDELAEAGYTVHFISADVTPRDRLATIAQIKEGRPCIVVSTQCIEAGVDIDMSLVIRDFSPLDSLIQIAGRCNRNADRPRETIEFVRLESDRGKQFCTMIYDKVLLQETAAVLNAFVDTQNTDRIAERHVFDLSREYFDRLRTSKDLGTSHTEAFARWETMEPIRELLRGVQSNQESFVVIEQSADLPSALQAICVIEDRWERRREFRKLAARIAAVTVSVYHREGFSADRFADRDPTGNFWLLRPGFYRPDRGIDLSANVYTDDDHDLWGKIL